jgi:hypothetical protein
VRSRWLTCLTQRSFLFWSPHQIGFLLFLRECCHSPTIRLTLAPAAFAQAGSVFSLYLLKAAQSRAISYTINHQLLTRGPFPVPPSAQPGILNTPPRFMTTPTDTETIIQEVALVLLLRYNSSLLTQDGDGRTPFDIANGEPQIPYYLVYKTSL